MNNKQPSKYPIIVNGNGYIGNSTFRYTFPSGNVNLKDAKIALQSINMYRSFYNISNAYNNRIFTLAFPASTSYIFYKVEIPQGYYTIPMLNAYMQSFMIQNSLYLINDKGEYVYFWEIVENPSYYACQINQFIVPTAGEIQSGWTVPSGFIYSTVVGNRPSTTISDLNNFGSIIGFTPGTYSEASHLSNKTPQASPLQSIIIQCPNLKNILSNPSTNLYTFSPSTVNFGEMISSSANELVYTDLNDSTVAYLDFTFVDQAFNPITINDTELVMQLIILM